MHPKTLNSMRILESGFNAASKLSDTKQFLYQEKKISPPEA